MMDFFNLIFLNGLRRLFPFFLHMIPTNDTSTVHFPVIVNELHPISMRAARCQTVDESDSA